MSQMGTTSSVRFSPKSLELLASGSTTAKVFIGFHRTWETREHPREHPRRRTAGLRRGDRPAPSVSSFACSRTAPSAWTSPSTSPSPSTSASTARGYVCVSPVRQIARNPRNGVSAGDRTATTRTSQRPLSCAALPDAPACTSGRRPTSSNSLLGAINESSLKFGTGHPIRTSLNPG